MQIKTCLIMVLLLISLQASHAQQDEYVEVAMRFADGNISSVQFVELGEPFEAVFYLNNAQPEADYLFTCILNYRQVPCEWGDAEEATLLYARPVGEDERLSLSFRTPLIEDPFNDFMVIAFSHPFSTDRSLDYRISTDLNLMYDYRINLLAKTTDKVEPPSIETNLTATITTAEAFLDGLLVNQRPNQDLLPAWPFVETEPDDEVEYYVHLGNTYVDLDMDLALMAFLNYEQIPFDLEETWVQYVELPSESILSVPAVFIAPEKMGTYELLVVGAYNPYLLLDPDPQQPVFVDPSIRTAIVVK